MSVAAVQADHVVFSCDFEEGMPADFATYDRDGNAPSRSMKSYGIEEGIGWAAYNDGDNTAAYSGSWYKTPAQSDDWLVTSAIRVEDVRNILSWRAYALDAAHPDGYAVYVSETGNKPEDFVAPIYTVAAEKGEWQHHYVSLAQWAGKEIYVTFVNNSTNCNILALDDISIFSHDHSFVFQNTTPEAISTPGVVHVTGQITSSGFLPVEGYIASLTYNGVTTTIDRSTDIVAVDSVATFEFDIDIDVPLDNTCDYTLQVSSLDGQDVVAESGSITCFSKTVLIEEGTGTWCMWCPRGQYGLELLHEKYGDRFADVAIHGGDPMMDMPYYTGALSYFSGFPTCVVDRKRDLIGDPYYDIDSLYNEAASRGPIGKVFTTAHFVNDTTLNVMATAEFGKKIGEGEFSLLYIIVEDSVTGYEQFNAYSGGTQEMGGYEDKPDPIPAGEHFFANVGRKVYPSFAGDNTVFATGTPRHTPMTVEWSIPMPTVQRTDMVKVIAAITHTATGEVVNIHQVLPSWPEAVQSVEAHASTTIAATSQGIEVASQEPLRVVEVWNLAGELLHVVQPNNTQYTISLNRNHSLVIVKAATDSDVKVAKCLY